MTTFKVVTKDQVRSLNDLAMKNNYNRQLEPSYIDKLPDRKLFPIVFSMVHEHANGEPVEPHMRIAFYGGPAEMGMWFLDIPMEQYRRLPMVEPKPTLEDD